MPEIETERLLLRMFTPGDAEAFYGVISEPRFGKYFPPVFIPSLEKVREGIPVKLEHWRERGYGQWVIEPRGGGPLLGYCGLRFLPETEETEILYGIAPDHWGRGLVTEAARATLRYGFEETTLGRIIALANPANAGSRRVMEKAGLSYEKNATYFGVECAYYAISRGEFAPGGGEYILRG